MILNVWKYKVFIKVTNIAELGLLLRLFLHDKNNHKLGTTILIALTVGGLISSNHHGISFHFVRLLF